ncbi:hypothetical protein DBV15_02135 [Temnothorax longispinosus]|uniref:Uncharacterized protein n=1 Tax=Temnothorax longispinosus TaxID=300112 RepID=A0A4S2JNY0_9HYME|nr:hypothetical protein DBV15_02135 [Temnothorax longispinosus]
MPLCGAVTKLTRLSPDTDGCTLWTPTAAAPTVPTRLGGGIDSGRKESRKTLGRGRDWRRYTQTPSSSVKGEEETAGASAGEEVGRDAKAEEVREGWRVAAVRSPTVPGKGWKFAQA